MHQPKLYPYGCKELSVKQICELHPHKPGRKWVQDRLNKGMAVYEILAERKLTAAQAASIGAKKSKWGELNYRNRVNSNESN